ncbi:MAG TPA: DUF433 domain-containing protein [Tepidisphaeraceae bacterium]|jgi:uncharacterized protein (DUF433 family)
MSPRTSAIPVQHIALDERGRAYIDGTRIKVVELIAVKGANGWDADELARQYPHLTLAQIHAALSYYYDHQAAVDAEIERIDREYREHRAAAPETPLQKRIRGLQGM